MSEFKMPSLGADMESGILVEWLKAPGDAVRWGDILAVVETDKGAIEIEVFEDGVVIQTLAKEGSRLAVGEVLAVIDGEVPPKPSAAKKPGKKPEAPGRASIEQLKPSRRRVSPAARRHALELNVDLEKVHGTGSGGAVTLANVEQAAKAERPAGKPKVGIDFAAMRRAIATAMARANREIPHYYLSTTVDLDPLLSWLEELNTDSPVDKRILYVVPLIKAVALTLKEIPELNGHWIDGNFQPSEPVHVGVAIAVRGGGLIAPAIQNADQLSLPELMVALRDLSGRVRKGRMRLTELTGGTFTISNLGEGVTETMLPIISPPQVGILALGSIVERPWVVSGKVLPRRVVTASLGADHRCSDGRLGARFLDNLVRRIARPEDL